jgi:hypothetical protein
MTTEPIYYRAWHPCFEGKGDVVSIFLTPGLCERGPAGGREFFEAVLAAAHLDLPLGAWGVRSFITCYFTTGVWTECWEAVLMMSAKQKGYPTFEVNGVSIYTAPRDTIEPAPYLPLRVLADFPSRRAAQICKNALDQQASQAKWNDVHLEKIQFRRISSSRLQLLVDVVTVERSKIGETIPVAQQVLTTCTELGGRISYAP